MGPYEISRTEDNNKLVHIKIGERDPRPSNLSQLKHYIHSNEQSSTLFKILFSDLHPFCSNPTKTFPSEVIASHENQSMHTGILKAKLEEGIGLLDHGTFKAVMT